MKKYLLLFFFLVVVGIRIATANEPIKGIIATYEGSEVSYKLEDMPTIKYDMIEGVQYATLYMKDVAKPILRFSLAEGKKLVVVYGEYVPTVIGNIESDKATVAEQNGKKIIMGGELIIIGKDGKMYNIEGIKIKE